MIAYSVVTIPFSERNAMARKILAVLPEPKHLQEDYPKPFNDATRNHLDAIRAAVSKGQEWICYIQDDAVLCEGFPEKHRRRVMEGGFDVMSFFTLERWCREHMERGQRWVRAAPRTFTDVCPTMRTSVAVEFLEYMEQKYPTKESIPTTKGGVRWQGLDWGFVDFMKKTGRRNYICVPNLVAHNTLVQSALGHTSGYITGNTKIRNSNTFRPDAE